MRQPADDRSRLGGLQKVSSQSGRTGLSTINKRPHAERDTHQQVRLLISNAQTKFGLQPQPRVSQHVHLGQPFVQGDEVDAETGSGRGAADARSRPGAAADEARYRGGVGVNPNKTTPATQEGSPAVGVGGGETVRTRQCLTANGGSQPWCRATVEQIEQSPGAGRGHGAAGAPAASGESGNLLGGDDPLMSEAPTGKVACRDETPGQGRVHTQLLRHITDRQVCHRAPPSHSRRGRLSVDHGTAANIPFSGYLLQ